MKFRVMTMMVAIVAASFGSAMAQFPGGHIGLYWDAAGTNCSATVANFAQTDFFILATPDPGLPSGGITGAEFRVKGATASMILTPTANPNSNVALGNPFSDESQPVGSRGGANIAFPDCQLPDANGNVLLYTVSVLLLSDTTEIVFEVDQKSPPSNPLNNAYALVNACDAPQFTPNEASTGIAYMNHSSPGACMEVGVEERTWGQIKNMYN